jgi:hypothetical protein
MRWKLGGIRFHWMPKASAASDADITAFPKPLTLR